MHLEFAKAAKGLVEDSELYLVSVVSISGPLRSTRASDLSSFASSINTSFHKAFVFVISYDLAATDIEDGILLIKPIPKKPSTTCIIRPCHCSAIEWTAKLDDSEHILCHCDTCKKLGGGSYPLN